MRNVRKRRRSYIDLRSVTIGDWVILAASLLTFASLFMPWFRSTVPPHNEWAFTYSEWASVFVIVVFLATLVLIVYPVLSPDFGLPALPFATPPVFFGLGTILLLLITYESGKYACVTCGATSGRGFGVWVALFASVAYLVGATIKWGSRQTP